MATIGNSNIEASTTSLSGSANPYMNMKSGHTYTAVSGDEVDELFIYVANGNTAGQTIMLGIYDVTSGADGADLVGYGTVDPDSNTAAWYSVAVSIPLTAGQTYAIAWGSPSGGNFTFYRSTAGTADNYSFEGATTPDLSTGADPWTESSNGVNRLYSLYANVTNTPSGVTPEIVVPWAQRIVRHSGRFM